MCFNKLLVPLALAMLFNSAGAVSGELSDVSTEPTNCYELAWNGLGLTSGLAVSLCSGTTDAPKTLRCFMKAYGHPDENPRTLYSLRHFYATYQLFNGRNIHKLAIQMGTSVGMLEQHYSKLTPMLMAKEFAGG